MQLLWLHAALEKGGAFGCRFIENDLPHDWLPNFTSGLVGVGVDPATTEGDTSNPFAVCVTESTLGGEHVARMVFRFRSADPARCKAYLREIVRGVKPHAVAIDATNERFWCAEVKDELDAAAPVLLIVSSEKTEYMGERMNVKTYLGNLAVNAFEDRRVSLPNHPQIKNDMRLVRRVRGGFDNAVDGAGNHGDTFDAFKLSLHALLSDTTPAEAHAVDIRPALSRAQHRDPLPDYAPDYDDPQLDDGVFWP